MKAILANATNPAQHCKVLWQSTTFMRAQETATTWWLTGLPGAGKTTLAQALARALRQRGKPVCVIDGDELRAGLCQDLGFDDASRAENVRRAAHMARLLNDNAIHGVVAMVSPAVDARAAAYATVGLQRCKEGGLKSEVQHRRIEAQMSKRTYQQLSESERQAIALGLQQKQTISAIARALGRHKSTISREIERNAGGNGYISRFAQQRRDKRRIHSRPQPKLQRDGALFQFVRQQLKLHWSPQQIAGHLKTLHPHNRSQRVSHESI